MSCSMCQRREAAFAAQWQQRLFCAECVRRLGVFAATAPFEQRRQVWTVAAEQPPAPVATPKQIAGQVEEAFATLGIDSDTPRDFDVHSALGLAYSELGMHEDAIAEMGQAMADPKGRGHERALAVMFDPRHLQGDLATVLGTLRGLLFAN